MSPGGDPIVVACAADRAYLRPLVVMLTSVLAHLNERRHLAVHIVDGGISDEDKGVVARSLDSTSIRISWHAPDRRRFEGVPLWGRLPISVYDKLLVPDLLPRELESALWLDCDTLALDDVSPLWDQRSDRYVVQAVQDPMVPFVSSTFGIARHRELGLRPDAKYFNAGVLLMNLRRWRAEQIAARALAYLKRRPADVWFVDQEGLNAVLADNWRELDRSWNWSISLARGADRRTGDPQAKIVHFAGNLKPWIHHGRHPYYSRYYEYVDRTPWSGWRPVETWRARALRSYDRAALRRMLLPSERLGTRLWKALTGRVATAEDVTSGS